MYLIKRKILSGNFYNWIEESFDPHALKLISMKLFFRIRQLQFKSEWFNVSLFAEFVFLLVFQHIKKSIHWRNKNTIFLIFPWLPLELVEFPDFSLTCFRQNTFSWFFPDFSEFPDLADTLFFGKGPSYKNLFLLIEFCHWIQMKAKKKTHDQYCGYSIIPHFKYTVISTTGSPSIHWNCPSLTLWIC